MNDPEPSDDGEELDDDAPTLRMRVEELPFAQEPEERG